MRKHKIIYKTENYSSTNVFQWLWGLLYALIAGSFVVWLLVPFAEVQRGYSAIGGEWLLVLIISIAAFQIGR